MNRRQWLLFGAALAALGLIKLAVVAWYLRDRGGETVPETVSCTPDGGDCRLPRGGRLRFLEPPSAGTPFSIELSGVTAETEPAAEFSMQSMDMGFNRYRFVRAGARWRLRATLPVCVSGRRDWQMTLLLDGHRYRLPLQVHQDPPA